MRIIKKIVGRSEVVLAYLFVFVLSTYCLKLTV